MPHLVPGIKFAGLLMGLWLLAGCGGPPGGGGPQGGDRPPTNVIVAEARVQDVKDTIDLVGTLAANERVMLQSEIAGMIDDILFEEGDEVEQGQLLVKLEDDKLAARLREAEANFKLAQSNYNRYKELYEQNTVSQQELDQFAGNFDSAQATLELRQQELQDTKITAPFGGVMGSREISPGQYISPQQELTTMVDVDPLKADFDVPERFLSELEIGQTVNVGISAYPEKEFEATVYFIAPVVSETDRTVLVRARLDNKEHRLKPGMFGSLSLVLNVRENAVVIPESAMIQQSDSTFVMIVGDDGTAQRRAVQPGVRLKGEVEIRSGLEPGELVITEGHQKIGPGSPVNPLDASAGLPGGGAPPEAQGGAANQAKVTDSDSENADAAGDLPAVGVQSVEAGAEEES